MGHWADIKNIKQTYGTLSGNWGHWADIGQTLGRHWADIGQTLGRHWADIGQTLGRYLWTLSRHWDIRVTLGNCEIKKFLYEIREF